ncbi:MAG: hypothetical protein LBC61_07220 [Candidatus Peribacteria bacterium]|jgi:ribosomal protein S6|nr:hypothetical protein [Candidatus Peribacteria bacterium]
MEEVIKKTKKEILKAIENDALNMDGEILEELKELEEARFSDLNTLSRDCLIEEILRKIKIIEDIAKSMYIKYESLK